MRKYFVLVCIAISSVAAAQDTRYRSIDSIIHVFADSNRFSGVVLMADAGKIMYEQAFGYRSFATRIQTEKTDIFELASVSKQFTAMTIMMLKEKGLLQYDDPVEKYLDIPYKGITIRNLLTHNSGLPDYQATMNTYWDKSKIAGNDDIIAYLNKYAPPKLTEPGVKYAYSNTGYVLLASITEKISGRKFAEFCATEIFRKLQMGNTAIRSNEEKATLQNLALGHIYIKARNAFINADSFPSSNYTIWLGNRVGPGRISSTVEDLLKWDQALYTEKLVSQQTLKEAFTSIKLADGTVSNYGFGWMISQNKNAGKVVWHNGDNPGYKTEIVRVLGSKRTLIVLCNSVSDQYDLLIKQLNAVFIN